MALGGGRRTKEDAIDPRVGLMVRARLGDALTAGDPLVELHLAVADPRAAARAAACFTIGEAAQPPGELILGRVG